MSKPTKTGALAVAAAAAVLTVGGLAANAIITTDNPVTWADRLGAEGATVDAQISALQNQIDALQTQNAQTAAERDDALLQITALKAEIGRLTATPTPTPSVSRSPSPSPSATGTVTPAASMLVGSSLYSGTNETSQQAFNRRCHDWGVCPEIVRHFYPGLPGGAWPTFGTGPTVVSFKVPSIPGFAAGDNDAALRAFLQTVPADGRSHYITVWHEPEDDIIAGRFSFAQYRAATIHLQKLATEFAGSGKKIRVGQVLMGWTLDPRSGRDVNNYLVPNLDFIGWDVYSGITAAEVTRDYTPAADVCDTEGVAKCFLTETAPNSGVNATQAQKATYITVSTKVARALGFDGYMYFDSTVGGDFRLLTQQTWDAMAAEINR